MKKHCFFVTIVILCCCFFTGCYVEDYSTTNSSSSSSLAEESIDISAYPEFPLLDITVDIDKDPDSHLFECVSITKNNTNKKITEINLYVVKCYDNDTPIESYKYADRLSITEIQVGETRRSRWILGTTTEGADEYKVYLAYVKYEDGTTWGLPNFDHKKIVTRNAEVNVCVYGNYANTTEQKFKVSYSARIVSNSHVGDNWSYGMKVNDTTIKSGETLTVSVHENRGPRFTIYGVEDDKKDDSAQEDITFSELEVGKSETITEQIVIVENEGHYIGHQAYMEFTVSITRIS